MHRFLLGVLLVLVIVVCIVCGCFMRHESYTNNVNIFPQGTYKGGVYMRGNGGVSVLVSTMQMTFDGKGQGTAIEMKPDGTPYGDGSSVKFIYNENTIASIQPNGCASNPVNTHGVMTYVTNADESLTMTIMNLNDALPIQMRKQ